MSLDQEGRNNTQLYTTIMWAGNVLAGISGVSDILDTEKMRRTLQLFSNLRSEAAVRAAFLSVLSCRDLEDADQIGTAVSGRKLNLKGQDSGNK